MLCNAVYSRVFKFSFDLIIVAVYQALLGGQLGDVTGQSWSVVVSRGQLWSVVVSCGQCEMTGDATCESRLWSSSLKSH